MTGTLRDAARSLHARVRSFFDAPLGANPSPLELLQATLDELERKVQPSGRGARVFPYTRVVVHVRQPEAARPAIQAVFRQLDARLRERLAEIRCEIPTALAASVSVADSGNADDPVLLVECGNEEQGSVVTAAATEQRPALKLIVVKGQCSQGEYSFASGAVAIGRGGEPSDVFGRVRRNDVAFLDVRDGVTETVARAHARIEFDSSLRAYLLYNESTSNPTFLLRAGRSMRVAPRDPRGVRLQTGDELQLGRAIVRIAD